MKIPFTKIELPKFAMAEKPETFILVKESETGINTYISPKLREFPDAYKKQLISFLEGCIKFLK